MLENNILCLFSQGSSLAPLGRVKKKCVSCPSFVFLSSFPGLSDRQPVYFQQWLQDWYLNALKFSEGTDAQIFVKNIRTKGLRVRRLDQENSGAGGHLKFIHSSWVLAIMLNG